MVARCIICKAKYEKGSGRSLHAFPHQATRRLLWTEACKLKSAPNNCYVCSLHFTKNMFLPQRDYGIRLLTPTAVPSVFPWIEQADLKEDNNAILQLAETPTTIFMQTEHENSYTSSSLITAEERTESTLQFPSIACTSSSSKDRNDEDCRTVCEQRQFEDVEEDADQWNIWRPSRIGDLQVHHFSTPRRTKRHLQLIKDRVREQSRKMNVLQQRNRRLQEKVKSFAQLISVLQKKNFISEDAVRALLVT